MSFWRIAVIKEPPLGSHAFAASISFGGRPGPNRIGEVTAATPASSCELPRHELFRYYGARFPCASPIPGPLHEKFRATVIGDSVVEYFINSVRQADAYLCCEVYRCGQRRYRLKRIRSIRHMLGVNPLCIAVSVNEEVASVTAEHSKGGESNSPELAVRGGPSWFRLWFRATIFRIKMDLVSSVNVVVHFPNACIKVLSVPFLCTD